ncbi:MAG: GNAT family N-acetyltransferase [Anaerolineae bacterium]|nr:GNAT family N-acetyltransferase [Anaerolineae bacterium]
MTDMLVKLYTLPPLEPTLAQQREQGLTIRRAIGPEKHSVVDWVARYFNPIWASECDVSFSRQPIACFIALKDEQLVGFACHDATCLNFFGPTGVSEKQRGQGIGQALLLICLHAMAAQGYAYGIVGDVGPREFYAQAVGAIEIPDSTPGIYGGMLRPAKQ